MLGAIVGDIVGSRFEFDNIKTKDFYFVTKDCSCTDDTVMTVAVARALIRMYRDGCFFKAALVEEMKFLGNKHKHAGYGGRFCSWLRSDDTEPYNSYGNGSAMRVSPCAFYANNLSEALELAKESAEVTHNHPEGIKGAQAVAAAIFLARSKKSKAEIRAYIEKNFYPLSKTLDEIRPTYEFNETCQGSVPEAITAFLESVSFEDAIRNAVSIGGDSDTIAAIAGSIAFAFYMDETDEWKECVQLLKKLAGLFTPEDLMQTVDEFDAICRYRGIEYEVV